MPTASVECRQDRRTRGTLRATLPILLLMLALGACTNLTAVSDFAKLGSNVTASSAAIDSYPTAASEQARMAPVATSAARKAQAAKAVDQTKAADLGMQTLSLYLSTLAQLADDKLVDVQASATGIGGSLKTLGVLNAAVAEPASAVIDLLVTAPLDAWRRQAVANLIEQANQPVQKLGTALADFAKVTALTYDQDIAQANIYYRGLGARSHDPAIRALLDEWRMAHTADYAKTRDQALAAETALRKIVQGQAELQAHKNALTGAELKALLAQYQGEILTAAKLLPFPSAM